MGTYTCTCTRVHVCMHSCAFGAVVDTEGKQVSEGGTSTLLGSHVPHIFAVHKGPIRLWLPRQHLDENSWRELRRIRSSCP